MNVGQMDNGLVIGKIEATYSYDLLLRDDVESGIRLSWPGMGKAELYPLDKLEHSKLHHGQYGSKIRMEVTLDLSKKPAKYSIDQFFLAKFSEFAYLFTFEAWLHTRISDIDPHIEPRFIKIEYFKEDGTPFTNPETGKPSYEEDVIRGAILEKKDWEDITNNLVAQRKRDLGEEFLQNAKYMKSVRRYDAAIIFCAIACEYKVKFCCDFLASRNGINSKLWEVLIKNLHPRVMYYYKKILPELLQAKISDLNDGQFEELLQRLEDLFEDRNRIMHTGMLFKGTKINPDEIIKTIDKHIETTELSLSWLNEQLKTDGNIGAS